MKQVLTCQSQKRHTVNGEMMQEWTAEPYLSPQHNRDPLHTLTKQIGKGSCIWQMLKTLSTCDWAGPVNIKKWHNDHKFPRAYEENSYTFLLILWRQRNQTKPNLTKTKKRKGQIKPATDKVWARRTWAEDRLEVLGGRRFVASQESQQVRSHNLHCERVSKLHKPEIEATKRFSTKEILQTQRSAAAAAQQLES